MPKLHKLLLGPEHGFLLTLPRTRSVQPASMPWGACRRISINSLFHNSHREPPVASLQHVDVSSNVHGSEMFREGDSRHKLLQWFRQMRYEFPPAPSRNRSTDLVRKSGQTEARGVTLAEQRIRGYILADWKMVTVPRERLQPGPGSLRCGLTVSIFIFSREVDVVICTIDQASLFPRRRFSLPSGSARVRSIVSITQAFGCGCRMRIGSSGKRIAVEQYLRICSSATSSGRWKIVVQGPCFGSSPWTRLIRGVVERSPILS